MSDTLLIWSGIFAALAAAYLVILYREKDRKLYSLYFIFGMVFGFYFDAVSVAEGYYAYPELFVNILGVPLAITMAEGFSVAITIRLFEFLRKCVKFRQS